MRHSSHDASAFEPDAVAAPQGSGEDDFYCLRFGIWYPSLDCAVRTRYRTCPSCAHCDQGRFNVRRHGVALAQIDRSSLGRTLRG